jgi:uncharacterized membrane protein
MKKATRKEIEEGKLCSILSYLLVGIIWWLVDENLKKNSFVKFHVKQSIVLLIFSVILSIVVSIFYFIPIIGMLLSMLTSIFLIILVVIGIVHASEGKEYGIPIIGEFAEKFSI